MKIVIDTNVVISAVFFKGKPLELIKKVINHSDSIEAYASMDIVLEYEEIFKRMIEKKKKEVPEDNALDYFISSLTLIEDTNNIHVSRDPDDDKFLECAFNCKAIYIVSGDNDLLDIKEYEGIKIVKVDEFLKVIEKK